MGIFFLHYSLDQFLFYLQSEMKSFSGTCAKCVSDLHNVFVESELLSWLRVAISKWHDIHDSKMNFNSNYLEW